MARREAVGTLHSERRHQRRRTWRPVLSALILCGFLRCAVASVAQFSAVSSQCGAAGVQARPNSCRRHVPAPTLCGAQPIL